MRALYFVDATYCWSLDFSPSLFSRWAYDGYLPMAECLVSAQICSDSLDMRVVSFRNHISAFVSRTNTK